MILGIDVSHWQANPLPWAAWHDRVSVVSIQITHGLAVEGMSGNHLGGALAAGYKSVGAYHFLMPGDTVQQAMTFLRVLQPEYTWIMLDVEQPGVGEPDVRVWCDQVTVQCHLPLYLYGNNQLAAIIAANPALKKYPVWWANYPRGTDRISAPPAGTHATAPPGLDVAGWQFTGTGLLPPYAGNIDLSVWYRIPDGAPVAAPASVPNKLGPHHMLGGSETGRWLALVPAVAKAVDDLGALSEARPGTLTIGRCVDDHQLDGQGFDMNRQRLTQTPDQAAAQYVAFLANRIRLNPWVQVWEGPNEQVFGDKDRQATMEWYADFCYQFAG